ncbi:MAG: lytic murein transglycosylase [Alphaproteobacteria bacterium]|nr:lytic murein transglycosylase [Alphaproteobacteria bacterium]
MKKIGVILFFATFVCGVCPANAARGDFDFDRWNALMDSVRDAATAKKISGPTIDATLKNPVFIPRIVYNDKNQSEFKLTLSEYLRRTVSAERVKSGHNMAKKYPTLLGKTHAKYGVPKHVILAFWGMESNYGAVKSAYRLKDAFFTLMYDGRREKFFTEQLLALMKIADKNTLDINNIYGSWAGAMGHFQFIPTTLAAYGADGNADGKIDIINNVSDAMFSAGNYLNKLGWDDNQPIARRVLIPIDFDDALTGGDKKYTINQWAKMGVLNADGSPLTATNDVVGLVAGADDGGANLVVSPDNDVEMTTMRVAYLTYPNFYRIKRWNNSNWYAIAIHELSEKLK